MSLYRDKHGGWHADQDAANRANERIDLATFQAQKKTEQNTEIAKQLAEITASSAVTQTKILLDKAKFERVVSFLDGESNENKWDVILKETKPEIIDSLTTLARKKIQEAWAEYRRKNNLDATLLEFKRLETEQRRSETRLKGMREQRMYPNGLIDSLSKAMSKHMAWTLFVIIAAVLWLYSVPALAIYAFIHRPSRMKKLIAAENEKIAGLKKRHSAAWKALDPFAFASDPAEWKTTPESCLEYVWSKIEEWQSDYPPRCRMQRDDKLLLPVITAALQSVDSHFKCNAHELVYD